MLTGTRHPYVPPRPKSRPVPARSVHSGPFRPVSAGNLVSAGTLFGLWFLVFFLCFESAGLNSCFHSASLLSDLSASPLCSDLSSSFKWLKTSQPPSSFKPLPVCPLFLPPPAVQFSPVQPSFKPLPTVSAASSSPVQPSFKLCPLFLLPPKSAASNRFSLSFQESPDDMDGSEVDMDENGRPYFSSIAKGAGFLDKELAASGFTFLKV